MNQATVLQTPRGGWLTRFLLSLTCGLVLILLALTVSARAATTDTQTTGITFEENSKAAHIVADVTAKAVKDAIKSGESLNISVKVSERGEILVNDACTGIFPATGTDKVWLDGATLANGDVFVADYGQFRLYRQERLVDYVENGLKKNAWSYEHEHYGTVMTNEAKDVVYLVGVFKDDDGYFKSRVFTWSNTTGEFSVLINRVSDKDYPENEYANVKYFVYSTGKDKYDYSEVRVLNTRTGVDRLLAEDAFVWGGFNGFVCVRFRGDQSISNYGDWDHYTGIRQFAEDGTTYWWDEYGDADIQRLVDEGKYNSPIPHRRLKQSGGGIWPTNW